jgi:molybdenum cofactor synthesis domain-containing protein
VSDRVARGEREDSSGPLAVELLQGLGFELAAPTVVADGRNSVADALRLLCTPEVDLVVTTGGTGLAPRDETPEGTADVLSRDIPGLAELIRSTGLVSTPMAVLSRGRTGTVGRTLVINLAGSPGAVRDGIGALAPVLPHAITQLAGGDH